MGTVVTLGPELRGSRGTVEITIRSVYGVDKAYPANDLARQFAELIGQRTLLAGDLKRIEALGFEVRRVAAPSPVYVY